LNLTQNVNYALPANFPIPPLKSALPTPCLFTFPFGQMHD